MSISKKQKYILTAIIVGVISLAMIGDFKEKESLGGTDIASTTNASYERVYRQLHNVPSVLSDRLGLAFPGKQEEYYHVLKEAGLGVVRIGVFWKYIEPTQGIYSWDSIDTQVYALQKLGIQPFFTLYSDAPWGVRAEDTVVLNKRPKDLIAWQSFIHNLVERYDGDKVQDAPGLKAKVQYYQVANEWISNQNKSGGWNGTTNELISFINASYRAVKQADPSANFVLGGIATFNLDLMAMLKGINNDAIHQKFSANTSITITPDKIDALGYKIMQHDVYKVIESSQFDYADVHLYGESYRNVYRIKALKQHTNKPLLSSECGGPSLDYNKEYKASEHFVSVFDWTLSSLSQGLRFCLWFQLGEGEGSTWGNHKVALFDSFRNPKPGFWAYRLLAHLMQDLREVTYVGTNIYKLTYAPGKEILVAWRGGDSELSAVKVMSIFDNENKISSKNALYVLRMTNVETGQYYIDTITKNSIILLQDIPVIIGQSLPQALIQ